MTAAQPSPNDMSSPRFTINVIGTGYVGLPAAILLADAGHQVTGVDVDENVVRAINEGVLHIDEEELAVVMARPAVKENLEATDKPVSADVFMIAVPTPLDARKKVADLSMLISAIENVARVIEPGALVIVESTIPPLTCRSVVEPIFAAAGHVLGESYELAHCPERILPGNVFHEIVHNDRIIGSRTEAGRERAAQVYASFVKGELLATDDITAELTKLCENAARDVGIAFANEMNEVASALGADATEVISLANRHPRINILQPGIGVGGHCIPIDPWFIKQVDPVNTRLIVTARTINDERPGRMAAHIRRAVAGIDAPKILLVGATYKPDTYDMRESPATHIYDELVGDGYRIERYDPIVPELSDADNLVQAATGFDAVFVLVPHQQVKDELANNQSAVVAAMRGDIVQVLP